MFKQCHIEIQSRRIVQRVPAHIAKGEARRRSKSLWIIQQGAEGKWSFKSFQKNRTGARVCIRIGACAGAIRYSSIVQNGDPCTRAAAINDGERRSGLSGRDSRKFTLLEEIPCKPTVFEARRSGCGVSDATICWVRFRRSISPNFVLPLHKIPVHVGPLQERKLIHVAYVQKLPLIEVRTRLVCSQIESIYEGGVEAIR